jgi:hypothetical protein
LSPAKLAGLFFYNPTSSESAFTPRIEMVFDVSVAMTWLLLLALFPITYFWLRRAWRILIRRDFSEVAIKGGVTPPHPEKYAPYAAAINLTAGSITLCVIFGVIAGSFHYDTWTAIAGTTLWMKLIFDFILSRHAHPIVPK